MKKRTLVPLLLTLVAACGGTYLGLPAASPESGYGIVGYVGKSSQEAAPSETVTLTDANGQQLGAVTTDFMGKYTFYPLQPGTYLVTVGEIQKQIIITNNHQRVDIDLSAKDGTMNYAAGAAKGAQGGPVTAQGPNDPELQRQFAGYYWGFSGVSGGGGGTERKKTFCADGTYYDDTESSYYGTSHDQYGNEDMSWGSAADNRKVAKWTITGSLQGGTITITWPNNKTSTIEFRAGNEANVYIIDGATLSRTGPGDKCR